jgi:hypothetical protein
MKRFLLIGAVAVLALSLSTPTMAIEWSVGGLFRTRAFINNDFLINRGVDNTGSSYEFYDQRFDLSFTAKISEDLKAVWVITNSDNSVHPLNFPAWGLNGGADTMGDGTNNGTFFRDMHNRNLYVDFNLKRLPIDLPVNVKVGRMKAKIGHGFVFSGTPDAIALQSRACDVDFGFWTAKVSEGGITQSDDWDMYTLWASYSPAPNHTVGATLLFEYGKSGAIASRSLDGVIQSQAFTFGKSPSVKWRPWIIDLTADGKISDNVTYRAEFAYQGGTIKHGEVNRGLFGGITSTDDLDLSAYAAMLGADYDVSSSVGKPTKLTFEYGYGSGESDDIRGGDYNGFLMHDPEWWYADLTSDVIGLYLLNGLNNRQYIKLAAQHKPLDRWTCNVAYIYNRATEDNSEGGTYKGRDQEMGHEFDVGVKYQIFKNLSIESKFAYLVAGDYFEEPDGSDPNNPYSLTTTLLFKF